MTNISTRAAEQGDAQGITDLVINGAAQRCTQYSDLLTREDLRWKGDHGAHCALGNLDING